MNGNKIFIDTNICIYLLNGDFVLAELLQDQRVYISVITEIELYAFHRSDEALQILNEFIESVVIVEIDQAVKQKTIEFRKTFKQKLPDSIIAASAFVSKIPLISADKGFKRITPLNLIVFEKFAE